MSLIRKQTLVNLCCAARMLDLDESTLRKGQAGTESLTQVRRGNGRRQRVSFILEEVVELKIEWIEAARKPKSRLSLVG